MRILVVEDDAFLAYEMAQILEEAGFRVLGPAATVDEALALIGDATCDAAVLDIHLGPGETSEPIAAELRQRGTPFLTVTGYAPDQRPAAFIGTPVMSKPIRAAELVVRVRACAAGQL